MQPDEEGEREEYSVMSSLTVDENTLAGVQFRCSSADITARSFSSCTSWIQHDDSGHPIIVRLVNKKWAAWL